MSLHMYVCTLVSYKACCRTVADVPFGVSVAVLTYAHMYTYMCVQYDITSIFVHSIRMRVTYVCLFVHLCMYVCGLTDDVLCCAFVLCHHFVSLFLKALLLYLRAFPAVGSVFCLPVHCHFHCRKNLQIVAGTAKLLSPAFQYFSLLSFLK